MSSEEIGAQLLLEDIEQVLRQRINSDQDELLALQRQADEIREFLQLLRQPRELEDISGTSTGTEDAEVVMVHLKNAPSLLTTLTPTHDQPTDVEEELEYVETDAVPTWSHIALKGASSSTHEYNWAESPFYSESPHPTEDATLTMIGLAEEIEIASSSEEVSVAYRGRYSNQLILVD